MSADKPVSLAERCHVERCFCHSSDCEGLFCVDETCVCLKGEKARDPRCVALEAEAKALERMIVEGARAGETFHTELADRLCLPRMNRAPNDILEAVSQDKQRAEFAEARVEALVEVLRNAPEPPNFAGLANLGVDPWTWVEHYREWYESRAAALADEPRKETHEAD